LYGSSHVSLHAADAIKKHIRHIRPNIVCVELDPDRLQGLIEKRKSKITFATVRAIGLRGTLFALVIGSFQGYIAKKLGVSVGVDMLTAVAEGHIIGAKTILIDQHAQITMRDMNRAIRARDMFTFIVDFFHALIRPKHFLKQTGLKTFDVSMVPDKKTVATLVSHFTKRYPTITHAILLKRNGVMVNNITAILKEYPSTTMVVVVGAAHVAGMVALLQKDYKDTLQIVEL
jgi:pheromone shutdown protein TraB